MKKLYLIILVFVAVYSQKSMAQTSSDRENLKTISEYEQSKAISLIEQHAPLIVNNYNLKYHRFNWVIDPAIRAISGSVTSYYLPMVSNMNSIQFELASNMSADSAFHRGAKVPVIHAGNLLTVDFNETVSPDVLDSITIYYHGNPNNSNYFYNSLHNSKPVLWTLSEPFGASSWWPSKNDLTDKVDSIDIIVTVPNGNHVASNGKLMSEIPDGPNRTGVHWKHRYPIASYLVAISVTNYARYTEQYSGTEGSYPIVNYVYPEDSAYCRNQTNTLVPVYELFSSFFGDYPFENEKYGNAEIGCNCDMEHQTMSFFGKSGFNNAILSHELAHQWFGDMVTCGSWHDIWLNEGFAVFCNGLVEEHTSSVQWQNWKNDRIASITSLPGGSVYCTDTSNASSIFNARLQYDKGAMVLQQLRWMLGDSIFFAGMKNYIEDPSLRYGFAHTADFIAHMESVSGRDLTEYFNNWIYKQGFPSYQITWTQDGENSANIIINQTQSHSSVSFFKMPVPVKFTGEGRDTILVFDNTFSGQSFVFNPGFKILSLVIDPDKWLITKNNQIALGVEEIPSVRTVTFKPNPVKDIFTIESSGLHGNTLLLVFNVDGKAIMERHITTDKTEIDISSLSKGVYFLKLINEKSVEVGEIIKE